MTAAFPRRQILCHERIHCDQCVEFLRHMRIIDGKTVEISYEYVIDKFRIA